MNVNGESLRLRPRYAALTFRPDIRQWIINELPLLLLAIAFLVYSGIDGVPLGFYALIAGGVCSLIALYRYLYIRRIQYIIGDEQLVSMHGVYTRTKNYIELYRVVDFIEHQNFLQQIFCIKSVTIISMDRSTPNLHLIGISEKMDIVREIRFRVEDIKSRKRIFETVNR